MKKFNLGRWWLGELSGCSGFEGKRRKLGFSWLWLLWFLSPKPKEGESFDFLLCRRGKGLGDRFLVSLWPRAVLKVEKSRDPGGRRLP